MTGLATVPAPVDLGEMFRGDTLEFDVPVIIDGLPLNLSGATIWATFKPDRHIEDLVAPGFQRSTTSVGVAVLGPAADGMVRVTIDASNTVNLTEDQFFEWDVKVRQVDGKAYTVAQGTLMVLLNVTHAIS